MSENAEKKVLVTAEIVDNFIKSKQNLEDWKKALKDAQKSGKETKERMAELARNLADANNKYREAKKVIESTTKAEEVFLIGVDAANKTLGEMQRELAALRNTPIDFGDKEKVHELKSAMAELTDKIGKYKDEIKGMDTGAWAENLTGSLQSISGSAQALSQMSSMFGIDLEGLEKLNASTVQLISITQGLGAVTEALEKKRFRLFYLNIKEIALNNVFTSSVVRQSIATAVAAKAEEAHTAMKAKGTIVTKAAAAAQWLWNVALAANPIVAITGAIIACVAVIGLLVAWLVKSNTAQKNAEKASQAYEKQAERTAVAIDNLNNKEKNATNERENRLRHEILL